MWNKIRKALTPKTSDTPAKVGNTHISKVTRYVAGYTVSVELSKDPQGTSKVRIEPDVVHSPGASPTALNELSDSLKDIIVSHGAQDSTQSNALEFAEQINERIRSAVDSGIILHGSEAEAHWQRIQQE